MGVSLIVLLLQESASNVDRARAEQDMELIKRKRHALHDPEPETPPAPRPKKRGPRVSLSWRSEELDTFTNSVASM